MAKAKPETPPEQTVAPEAAMPLQGGSYTRMPDGSLQRVQDEPESKAAAAEQE